MSIVEQAQTMSVSEQAPAMLSLQSGLPAAGGQVTVAILLNPAGAQITSLDLKLSFDPDLAQIVCAEPGSLVQGWIFAHNEPEAGEIWIGLAGSQPVGGNGSVATLVFQMQGTAGNLRTAFSGRIVERRQHPGDAGSRSNRGSWRILADNHQIKDSGS